MRAERSQKSTSPLPAKAANARDAALRVLARHAEKIPDLAPIDPDTEGMDPRDAALAHAIIDATVRRWLTLSYLIEVAGGRDVRDTEPRMQAALLGGAAQLLLFDRIPDHAAIDETVEWAKRRIRPKAGGMVNAILRRVVEIRGELIDEWDGGDDAIPLSEGGAMTLVNVRLPEDPLYRLAIACSLPASLLRSWEGLGADVGMLARHTLIHPPHRVLCGRQPRHRAGRAVCGPRRAGPRRVCRRTLGPGPGVEGESGRVGAGCGGLACGRRTEPGG